MSWHSTVQLDTVPTLYAYESWLPTGFCTAISWLCTAISWIRTAHMTQGYLTDPGLPTLNLKSPKVGLSPPLLLQLTRQQALHLHTGKMWKIYHKRETKVQLICCLTCSAADTEPSYFIGYRFASWSREYSLLTICKLQSFFECGRKMVQHWIYLYLWGFFLAIIIVKLKPWSAVDAQNGGLEAQMEPWRQCCGSGSGIGAFLTPGSRIPNSYFWELSDNFLDKKFHNLWNLAQIFFFWAVQKLNNFTFCEICGYKIMFDKNFFFHPSLFYLFLDPGSEIRDPGWVKIRIRDPG